MAERLIVIDVADLPWPWNPFRCKHCDEFRRRAQPEDERTRVELEAMFEVMIRELPLDAIAECPYHEPDWVWASEAAIDLHARGICPLSPSSMIGLPPSTRGLSVISLPSNHSSTSRSAGRRGSKSSTASTDHAP